jgi:hypothetical protein
MFTRSAESLSRHSLVGLPLTAACGVNAGDRSMSRNTEVVMRYILLLTVVTLCAIAPQALFGAQVQEAKGQNCHMEQQCHWENFKKVCVYVKVCR